MTLDFLEGSPEVPAASIGLTDPGKITDGDSIDPGAIMARIVTDDISGGDWAPGSQWRPGSNWFPGSQWIPDKRWVPRSSWEPGSDWVPDNEWFHGSQWAEDGGATEMLVTTGDRSFESVFGRSVEDYNGRPFEDGETITTRSRLIAAPAGDSAFPEVEAALRSPEFELGNLFEAAVPAPLSGTTFGLGVLSTPAAEIAGQSVNPLGGMGLEEILTSGQASNLLQKVGVGTADYGNWHAGPTPLADGVEDLPTIDISIRGQETELKTFTGVVSGGDGPLGVIIHMGRIQADGDIVIVATAQARPVSDAEIPSSTWLGNGDGNEIPSSTWLGGGIDLAATAIGSLETASAGSG